MIQPDFLIIPTQLLSDDKLQPSDRILFGYIYWMEKLALMKCVATNRTFCELTGFTEKTISISLARLEQQGYVSIIYKDESRRHRVEIQSQIAFSTVKPKTDNPRPTKRSIQTHQTVSLDPPNVPKKARNNRGKLVPNKSIKEDSIKKEVVTKVTTALEAPVVYGKPELNELFQYWTERTGLVIHSRPKPNRNACSNLYRKFGTEGVRRLIDGAAEAQTDQYAPNISDFEGLQAKLNDLLAWGKRRAQKASNQVAVIS